jgi:hypothetical protein
MTLFEWKISDLGNGEFGHIWISEPSLVGPYKHMRVYVDPNNVDGHFAYWIEHDPHVLFNCELPEDWEGWYERILGYWRNVGSPVVDRKPPSYEAPWFPWIEAGFTVEERNECIGSSDSEANFERAAEFMEHEVESRNQEKSE